MSFDLHTYCKGCGTPLPDGPYAEAREWCSKSCYMAEYHAEERAARLEAKKGRPPCQCCGKPVPAEKPRQAIYCTVQCQRRGGRAKWRLQFARVCRHCQKPFVGHNAAQAYCCIWCKAQATVRRHQPRPCQWCGAMITDPRQASRKYCCGSCAAYAREAARRKG